MEAMEKLVDEPDRTGAKRTYFLEDIERSALAWYHNAEDREPWWYYPAVAAVLVFVVALPIFWR